MSDDNHTPDPTPGALLSAARPLLHLFECDGEFVYAIDPEDADKAFAEDMNETIQSVLGDPGVKWTQVPDDKPFTSIDEDDNGAKTTKTAAEWGVLCGRGHAWSNNI